MFEIFTSNIIYPSTDMLWGFFIFIYLFYEYISKNYTTRFKNLI